MSGIFFRCALKNTKDSVSMEADSNKKVSTQCVGEFKILCYLGCTPCLKLSTLRSRSLVVVPFRGPSGKCSARGVSVCEGEREGKEGKISE